MEHVKPQEKTVIIGGGWAGLSCAYLLGKKGLNVTLLEAGQLGGRARGIPHPFANLPIDNGQHLLVGAYQAVLSLIKDVCEKNRVLEHPQSVILPMVEKSVPFYHYRVCQKYPKGRKLTLWSTGTFSSIVKLLPYLLKLKTIKDIPFLDFCQQLRLEKKFIKEVLGPMVHAALSTPIEMASTHIVLNVLREVFHPLRLKNSKLIILTQSLSQYFIEPIVQWSKSQSNVHLHENHRVITIKQLEDKTFLLITSKGEINADKVIIATPFYQTACLLKHLPQMTKIKQNLEKIQHQFIGTIYFVFDATEDKNFQDSTNHLFKNKKMIGVLDEDFDYVFYKHFPVIPCEDEFYQPSNNDGNSAIKNQRKNNQICGYHLLSAVILRKPSIATKDVKYSILQWLEKYCGLSKNKCLYSKAIMDKRGAFSCTVDSHQYRTSINTPVKGLMIIGDHVKTELPATLEGAVRSAYKVSELYD